MYLEIFSILAPVFICSGIGFLWSKSGKHYDIDLITAIVSYIATPCLIFYSLSALELHFGVLLSMALASLAANVCFIVLGAIFLTIAKLPQRAFLQTLSFPNIGNIGLPLCFLAFGQEGLALGITFFTVYAVFQLTVGAAFVSGSFSVTALLKMPIIPATVIAVVFLVSGLPVPKWLYNTTKLIGDLTIPLMLFTLGVSLSELKVAKLKVPLTLSLVRMIMGFGIGVLLAKAFRLEGAASGVVILQCSMPAAVFCYLFAQLYDQRPDDVAGAVILSTLISFVTLPLLLWYIL